MVADRKRIDPAIQIPDLLRQAPQARVVLDRYGLRGCGGPLGPHESLAFFSRAHGVPLERLIAELELAVNESDSTVVPLAGPDVADTIYRRFFLAGIAVVLTLGAVWGAYLLLRIALARSFSAAGLHEINAHGHAQIFGWVGLFVMGFAYQAFPRFKHTTLSYPYLAIASWWLMILGVVCRSVAEPLAADQHWIGSVAIAAAVIEVVAIALFVVVIGATWRQSGKSLAFYDYYIVSALGWFLLQAIGEAFYLAASLGATGPELVRLVATWQAPLRDLQIHGFAMLMILGVSQRAFHHFYGLPAPNARRSRAALVAINLTIAGEAVGLALMRLHHHAWVGLWYASVVILALSVSVLVSGWHLFRPAPESDRTLKFLRAAYIWLGISLWMLVLLPAYQFGLLKWLAPESAASTIGFSHAYYGATRHAITVGFISLMIVGVAAKVVPILNGVDGRALSRLWLPFILINLGCLLRVVGQIATDFTAMPYAVAGLSGLLEVTGLAVWGSHLVLIIAGRYAPSPPIDSHAGATIDGNRFVADVIDQRPDLLPTLIEFGFRPLANPILRKTAARRVTLRQACQLTGANLNQLLQKLNHQKGAVASNTIALPVVENPGPQHLGNSCTEERNAPAI